MNTLDKYVQKHIVKYSGAGPISKGGGASSNLSMSLDTAALAGRIDDIEEQLKLIAASLKNYHTLSITFENIDLPLVDIHVSGGMAVLSGYTEVIPETTITVDTSLWVAGVNKYIVWYNGTIVVADEILEGYKLLAYIIIPEDWDGTVSNSYKDGAAYISIAGPIDELDPYYGEVLILELDAEAGPFFCIVHASWDPLGSPDVSHYILSYTIDGNNWENISTANPAASFEAPHNIQVAAKVQAVFNNGRKTHWSATEIIQTPGDDTIPLPVTGLEVTSQFGIIKAIWDESTDIDFDTFEIQVARDDQFTDPEVTFTTNTSYAFAGEPEATYYIRVRVIDYSSNTSLWSDTIEIETVMGDGNTPAAPTGLTLVPILEDETSYITATWDRNEELDIVSYELAISYDQTNWVDYQTPKTTKTIEVVGGVTLYAKVRALDNEGLVSAWSDIVETTTAHDTEAPNIPVGLTITNSFGIVYFTWTANGEADFSHYIIQISQTDQFSTYDEVIQRTNSYSFSGIPGTTYYVRIKSVDYSGNESDWSSIASTTVTAGDGQPPATPAGLSLTTYLQSYSSYIEATWDENEEVDLLGYQIAWSLDQLKWNILSVNSPEANFSVPGNSTIYVKVKALDVEGLASQWSDVESITSAEDEEAPATPVLLSNIPLYARALIEIEEQEESDFSHFLVSYKDRSFTTSTTNIEIPLDPGESGVPVSIKAVDLSGNESPALAVSASARTLSEAEEEFFELINKVHGGSTNTETIAYITDDLVDHMNITKPTAFDRSGLLKDDVYDTIDRIDNIDYGDLTLPMESVFERIDTDFISVGSSLFEARSKIFDIEIGGEIKNIDEWVGVINTDVSDITTRIDFINYGELTGTIETVLGSVYSNVSAISEKIYDIVIGEITLDIDEWIDQINSDLSGVTTRINAVVYGSLTDTIEDVLAAVHGDISGIETKVFDIEIGEVTHDIDEWMGLLNGDVAGIISRLENVSYNETTDTIETQIAAIALDINGLSSIVYDITIDETTQDVNQWISTLSQRADSIELSVSGISQTVGEHTSSISQMSIDISGIEAVVYNITIDTVTQDVDQWVSQIKQEADAITLRLDHVVIDEDDQTLEQHVSQIKLDISGIESVVYDITIDTVTQDINQWVSTLSQRSDSIELSVQGLSQTVGEHSSSLSQLTIDVSGIEGVVYNIQIGEETQDVDQWISTLSQRADSIELSVSGLSTDVGENSASISQLVIDVSGIEGVVYDITVGEATQNIDQWVSQIKQEADAITLRLDHVVIDEDDQTLEQHVSQIKLDISGIESVVYDIQIGETTQDINQWISTLSQRADSIELNVSGISETVGTHTTNISSLQLDVSGIEAIVKDITIDTVTQDINEWVSQIKQEADAITLRLDNVVVDESTKTVEQHLSQIVLDIDGIEAIVKDITIDEVTQDVDLWISTLSQRADSIELSVQTVSQTVEGHTTTISQLSIDVSGIEGIVYNIEIGEDQYDVDQWISVLSQRADSIELSVTNLSGDVGTNTASIGQLTIDVEGIKTLVYDVTVGDVTHDIDEWLSALSQEDISIKQDLEAAALALRSKIESEFTNAETVLYIVGDPLDHQTDTAPINYDRTTSIFDITYDTLERLNNFEIDGITGTIEYWASSISQTTQNITLRIDGIVYDGEQKTLEQAFSEIEMNIDGITSTVYDLEIDGTTQNIDQWVSQIKQETDNITFRLDHFVIDQEDMTAEQHVSQLKLSIDGLESVVYSIQVDEITQDVDLWISTLSQRADGIELNVSTLSSTVDGHTSSISSIQLDVGAIELIVKDITVDETTQDADEWISQIKQEADAITLRLDHVVVDEDDQTLEQHVSQFRLDIDGITSIVTDITVGETTQDVDQWVSTLSQRADSIELSITGLTSDVGTNTSNISQLLIDVSGIELIVKSHTIGETTQDLDLWVTQIKQEADAITLRLDGIEIDEETKTIEQHLAQIILDVDGIESIVYNITIGEDQYDVDGWISVLSQRADAIELSVSTLEDNTTTSLSALSIQVGEIEAIVYDIEIGEDTYDVNQWISVLSQRSDAIELSVSTLSGDVGENASAISQLTIDVSGIEGVVYNITIDETTQDIDEWVSQIKQEADAITLRLDHVVIGEDDRTLEQHVSQIKIDIGGVESIVYDIQIGETTQDVNEWVSQIKQESDAIELRVETAEETITSHSSSISSLNLSVDGIEAVVYNIAVEEEGDIHDVDEWLALFHIRENAIELSITNLSSTVSSNTQSISSIEIDVGAIDLRVQSVESTTSTHTTQISDLDIALGTITATVGSIEDTVDGHTSSISQIELDISGITSTVQTISDTVGGHTSQISQINQDIGSIELAVQEVEEDVGTNTSAIAQIELSIDGITTSISTLETTVGGHTSQISQIELDIGTIELSVSSISSTVGQHTTDISAINVSLGEITTIVGTIEEDLDQEGDPLTQTYNYSLFQQLADSIALRVVAVDEFGDPQATELIIEDGLVTIAADQFRVHGDAMINGSISGDKLKANSVETNKLIVWPDIPIDDETAEYWGTSLLGALGITLPDGMDEVTKENLADLLPPGTILAEYFAVGQKMVVGNKVVIERDLDDYGHMTVFDSDYEIVVKVGENATPDGRDGMFINTGGAFQVGQLVDPNYLRYYNGILTIKGVVEATGGFFDEVVYVGVEEGERILLDGVNKLIRSENYQAGTAGFELNGDGTAEFNNITVRGSVHASEGSIDGVMTVGDIEIGVGVNEGAGTGWFVDENNYWYSNLGFSIGNGSTHKFQYSPEGGLEIVTTKILVDIDENILIDSENKVIAIGTMTGFDTASGNGVFTGMYNSKPSFKVGQNDPDGDLQKGISYYDGIFSFMGAVISMENLDDPTQEALSGYEVMISPAGDSVYNDGTTRTPTSINFTAMLLRKVDNTLVSSGLAYYWTVETDGGITIPSGALTATATVNTSSMTGPSVIKVKVTYQEKDYYGYASLAYSEKGTGGDDAVIYWLTSSKEKVVYNPNTGQYDGGASSSIVFTAKEAVGQVVQNKTGLYWKVNGVNAEPDANGYQKTVSVSSQTTTMIEIYADFAREQLLDTFTVPVITEGSDSYSIILSNEHQTVESNYDGTSPTPASISTQVKLYKGTTEITSFTVEATGATVDGKTVTVTIPSSSTMAGSQDITVKIGSTTIGVKTLTWSKSPQGEPGIGGEDAELIYLTASSQIFKADQDNTITSGDITLEAFLQNLSGTITWTAKNQSNNDITLTGTGSTRTLTAANFGASDWVKITVSLGGLSDSITIVRVKEGSNAIVGFLTNESHNVPCDSDGSNPDLTGASSILKIFRGNTQETSGWSCSWSLITGTATGQVSTTTLTNDTITIQSLSTDVAVYRCTATKSGQSSVVKDFTITKSYAGDPGDPGAAATSYYITSTKDKIVYDPGTGQYDGGATTTVTLSGWRKEGTNSPQATSFYWKRGATALGAATSKTITVPTDTSSSFTMTAYIDSSYTYLVASFTVAIVASGEPGDPGGDGVTRYISATKDKVVYDPNTGLYDGSASTTITFTAKKIVGDGSPANETVYWKRGSSALGSGTSKSVVVPTDTNTSFTMYTYADSGYTILLSSFTVSVVTSGASIYALPTASAYHVEYNGSSYSPSSVTITPALKQGTTSLSFTNWRIKYINTSGDLTTINRSTSSAYSFSMSLAQFIVPKTDVVLIIEIDYGGVTYTARLIIVVEDTRYGWLSQWTGTTLVGGTYIVTPTAFMGTDANNGVLIDANGILGKKSGAKTFELTDDGDLDVASGRIGGSSGWLIETLSGKGRISSTGIELVSGDDAYIQAGSSEENYRMNANGLEYRRLIKARINNIKAYAECDASASAIIEVWYRWTENYSDASPTWSSWQHPDDLNFSASFTWYITPTDPIYGADMTDFSMQFKFVIYSTSVFKAKLQKWNVYINDEPSLTVEIDTIEQFQAHADATTSGITYSSGGYVQPSSYSSSGTYVTKASSITKEIEPEMNVSKVLHSIHKGTVYFDGTSGNMSQRIYHNKHIDADRYDVILNERDSQIWKNGFSTSTNYTRMMEITKAEDYFDILFCAEEGTTSTNIGTIGMQSNNTWLILANVANCSKIEFDVYHWGGFRIFKEHVSHSFSSPYTGDIGYKYYDGILYLSWNGDTTPEYQIKGLVGMVAARDIIKWTSGTRHALTGVFNYEIQVWQ